MRARVLGLGAAHWMARAAEARELASVMDDLNARAMMVLVAEGYERLAARAQELEAGWNKRWSQRQ